MINFVGHTAVSVNVSWISYVERTHSSLQTAVEKGEFWKVNFLEYKGVTTRSFIEN